MPNQRTTRQCQVRIAAGVRTFARGCAIGVFVAVAAACAHYEPRPVDPVASAQTFAARRLDATELREGVRELAPELAEHWPPTVWNRADLLAVALLQNPELAVARAEARVVLAGEAAAAQTPNPDLSLQSEYSRDEEHPWLYGLALDVLLRTPSRKRLDVDIAQLATASARWQVVEQVWNVRRALTAALSDREDAQRRIELSDRLVAGRQRLLALQERRVAAGEDAPGELVVARAALLDAEQQRAQARSDAVTAQAALAAALGMPPEALDGVHIEWPDWGAETGLDAAGLRAAREQALLSRADLAAAISDYAETEKRLERAIARQRPELHLDPGYYWDHGVAKWPLSVGFSLPIFNRNEAEIAEAHAAREAAGQKLLAVQAGIYGRIEAALRAQAVASGNLAAAGQRLDAAHAQVRQSELGLKLGAIDRSERLGADATAVRTELDRLQAQRQWQEARNALEDALHQPLSGPELALRTALQADAPVPTSANGATP